MGHYDNTARKENIFNKNYSLIVYKFMNNFHFQFTPQILIGFKSKLIKGHGKTVVFFC